MRRSILPPPRRVQLAPVVPLEEALEGIPAGYEAPGRSKGREDPLEHGSLPGPAEARPVRRRLFDPASGWFRLLERRVSHHFTARLYPWIPGIGLPYGAIVDRHLTVCEADVSLAGLPRGFDGVSILLITDIHLGPFLPPRALRRAFDRLLALEPDLILLGGDLATSRIEEFPPHAPAFRSLAAPLGVFAVMGNHDHYTGHIARLRSMIEATGITVLHNRSVSLLRGGDSLALAGIDDLVEGEPDLAAALEGTPSAPVVLLSHNPDVFFDAARRGVSLVLSGHTHGGQIRIPRLPVLVRQSRYRLDEGRYETAGSQLVVSRGLGATGLPLRIACPPEAILLRLLSR